MSDKDFVIVMAVLLMVIQFLYRLWDKKDNKLIIEAIGKGIDSFAPHIERTKRTYGIVRDLKRMHDVRDDDGRPIWYMPKEIIETQRELVKLTHVVATTQQHMAGLIERMDVKIDEHKNECKSQFNQLDKKIP
jgi:Mg2+ and Co2+ transporter CorA